MAIRWVFKTELEIVLKFDELEIVLTFDIISRLTNCVIVIVEGCKDEVGLENKDDFGVFCSTVVSEFGCG